MIRVLSRLPESSILGLTKYQLGISGSFKSITYLSNEVAKLVTHPEWPSRVPRITNCSAILGKVFLGGTDSRMCGG